MLLRNDGRIQIDKATKIDAPEIIEYLDTVGGAHDNLLFGANGFHMSVEAGEKFIEDLVASKVSVLLAGKIENEVACVGGIMTSPRERICHHTLLRDRLKAMHISKSLITDAISQS